jgi:hypothetical protein
MTAQQRSGGTPRSTHAHFESDLVRRSTIVQSNETGTVHSYVQLRPRFPVSPFPVLSPRFPPPFGSDVVIGRLWEQVGL